MEKTFTILKPDTVKAGSTGAIIGRLEKFMTEGPAVLMVLEAENAIEKLRKVMGATDPAKAEEGTIRKRFGTNIERNAIHGSDGPDTAAFEISYFFSQLEIVG